MNEGKTGELETALQPMDPLFFHQVTSSEESMETDVNLVMLGERAQQLLHLIDHRRLNPEGKLPKEAEFGIIMDFRLSRDYLEMHDELRRQVQAYFTREELAQLVGLYSQDYERILKEWMEKNSKNQNNQALAEHFSLPEEIQIWIETLQNDSPESEHIPLPNFSVTHKVEIKTGDSSQEMFLNELEFLQLKLLGILGYKGLQYNTENPDALLRFFRPEQIRVVLMQRNFFTKEITKLVVAATNPSSAALGINWLVQLKGEVDSVRSLVANYFNSNPHLRKLIGCESKDRNEQQEAIDRYLKNSMPKIS